MVLLSTTPLIQQHLPTESPCHPHDSLIALSRRTNQPLHKLLRGSSIYHPPAPTPPPPTPEYLALKSQLQAREEWNEYSRLLNHHPRGEIEENQDPVTPSLVLNILLASVISAVVTFHLLRTQTAVSDAVAVLVGLGGGLVVVGAEAGLYGIYLGKVRRARGKERLKMERKVVITGDQVGEKGVD